MRRSTAVELALAVALGLAVILGAFAWIMMRWMTQEVMAVAEQDLSRSASYVESSLRLAMLGDHREDVRDVVDELTREKVLRDISIVSHSGEVWMSSIGGREGTRVGIESRDCALCHGAVRVQGGAHDFILLEQTNLVAVRPIHADGRCVSATCHADSAVDDVLGVLVFEQSAEQLIQTLSRMRLGLLAVCVAAILLASLFVGVLIAARLHRPMRDLIDGTERIAAGDMKYRIPIGRRDEFGRLAYSFNEMSRKLSESQRSLIQSERLVSTGRLAASVAHELNNPLTGVLAFVEDLIDDADGDDPRVDDLRVIEREALRCRTIVRDLLDFVRQEQPAMRTEELDAVVRRTLRLVEKSSGFRNVKILYERDPDLPMVEADGNQIQQVLLNLLINAADAMEGSGNVFIETRVLRGAKRLAVSVRDDGPGIPPDIMERIFEPLFSTKERRSNGLGLTISQGIVERHGGRLLVESVVGEGTTFTLDLKIATEGRSRAK